MDVGMGEEARLRGSLAWGRRPVDWKKRRRHPGEGQRSEGEEEDLLRNEVGVVILLRRWRWVVVAS